MNECCNIDINCRCFLTFHYARLKSGKDAADTMDGALKKHAADRIALLDELLLLDDDVEGLDPISVNVAAATAQTLQTMVGWCTAEYADCCILV